MDREKIGKYIKRTSLGIFALSVVTMGVDNIATSTAADNAYPRTISPVDKESADKTVKASSDAIERISVFIPEEVRSSLRMTVESSTQVMTAKKTITDHNKLTEDRSNYRAELRGSRELWEAVGVIGGITLAAVGNAVAYWRRGLIIAPARR